MTAPALRRSRHVDKRLRFIARELTKAPIVATYRVANGLRICIRHEAIDSFVLEEIFGWTVYEPPHEVSALLGELGRPPRILDLGANVGLFGVYALGRYPGAQVIAFEPNQPNAAVHRRCLALNGPGLDWELVEAFASTKDGHVAMEAEGSPLTRAVDLPRGTATVRVPEQDVLPLIAQADFVKMDIEGAEWPILSDPRLVEHPPAALVLEYHRLGCPDPRPAEYAGRLLEEAGYATRAGREPPASYNGEAGLGVLWAWRDALMHGSRIR